MIALIEAGVLDVAGPGMTVEHDQHGAGVIARSALVPDVVHRANALIEARLPETDIRGTTDPLITSLLERGECRPYAIPMASGDSYQTGGLAVTAKPLSRSGRQRRTAPAAIRIRRPHGNRALGNRCGNSPGVNSVIVCDADAIARASYHAAARQAASPALS